MTTRSRFPPRLVVTADRTSSEPGALRGINLADKAYDELEELLVTCVLPPGLFLSIQDLQHHTSMSRTPIHQAVNRFASDTLILIRPRHGLQVAPIDVPRERTLLQLRRDMERFVVRLATERAGASHRDGFLRIANQLRTRIDVMTIGEFNRLDREIDRLMIAAAGEVFLEHTLRPLHTIFRRIGWIYHNQVRPEESLRSTIDGHLAIVEAVANGRVKTAVAASDRLVAFVDSMFDVFRRGLDPALFDCNATLHAAS